MAEPFYRAEAFDCRQSLGYLARRLQNLSVPHAEAVFADAELSFTQWIMLMGLRDGVATTCAGLARHLNYDSGAMTRMVDQLEKRGLLTRTRSKDDRRVVELELTPDGRAMAARLLPRITDFWNGVLTDFSRSEFDTLVGLMAKLVDALEATPVVEPARKAGSAG